jgi:release factor glutamine methyltransferase
MTAVTGAREPVRWRALLDEATERLRAAGLPSPDVDARRMVEEASGAEGAEWVLALGEPATTPAAARFAAMVDRRTAGEPLQYVLGRWGFRRLDLMVDRRVLIPRPETEVVVHVALAEAAAWSPRPDPLVAVDLGTGSGAIALSIALEWPGADVWATDASPGALAVARANLAGLGVAGRRVHLACGSWFDALPGDLRGRAHLLVSNPPYVADGDALPDEVAGWEPRDALVSGPTGLEAVEAIVAGAREWLAHPGALVVEIAPHQADEAVGMARRSGFTDVRVDPDLAGRPRVLVARP